MDGLVRAVSQRLSDHSQTTIDIIRHGEPVGGRKYRGFKDDPLSEKGWRQMRDAVANFADWNFISSSPLTRCADFAQELSTKMSIPVQLDARFKEIDWGVWEGCTTEQICQDNPNALIEFRANPIGLKPKNAESAVEFYQRVILGWEDLVQQNQKKHILLVGHAGIIRSIMCKVLDIPAEHMFRIYVSNAAITRIEITHTNDGDYARLIFHDGKIS